MPASIVPERIAQEIRRRPIAKREPAIQRALLAGEVIHFDDTRQHFNGPQLRARHGVQLRSRQDGEGGRYWWVEPLS